MTGDAGRGRLRDTVRGRTAAAERLIGRLLIAVTYVAVGLLVIGVVLMIADGISPLSGGPPLDLATLGSQLLALEPAAYLWLGLLDGRRGADRPGHRGGRRLRPGRGLADGRDLARRSSPSSPSASVAP